MKIMEMKKEKATKEVVEEEEVAEEPTEEVSMTKKERLLKRLAASDELIIHQ